MPGIDLFDSEEFDLASLGKPAVVNGKLVWKPAVGIDPGLAKLLQASVKELNQMIRKGERKVMPNGEVK